MCVYVSVRNREGMLYVQRAVHVCASVTEGVSEIVTQYIRPVT